VLLLLLKSRCILVYYEEKYNWKGSRDVHGGATAAAPLPPWWWRRGSGAFFQITIAVRRGSSQFLK